MAKVQTQRPDRVAIVGGGIAGAASALALQRGARTHQRSLELAILTAGADDVDEGPLLLTSECRARLAALGCRVPGSWREGAKAGIELIGGTTRRRLPYPEGSTWIVDGFPAGPSGRSLVRDLLLNAAHTQGARVVRRRVSAIERMEPLAGMPVGRGAGNLVVRSGGAAERFDLAVVATGTATVGAHLLPGHAPPPLLHCAQARISTLEQGLPEQRWLRVWFAPMPGMDALLLVPCADSTWALGIGERVSPADLCHALMCAAREGLLPEGFEIASISPRVVPAGVGRNLVGEGVVAVGHAALGSPLQLSLSQVLATSTRAATALLEVGADRPALRRRYVDESLFTLRVDAQLATRALGWLTRARGEAPAAWGPSRAASFRPNPWAGGMLGLASPSPRELLISARRAAARAWFSGLWRRQPRPALTTEALFQPDLYYVVDDDLSVRESLTALLESHGARVVSFSDETALFAAVARRPPAAVLLDVVLRWVDGLRLCRELKRHPDTRNTRVIVMSGLGHPNIREQALRAGAEAFLDKPVGPDQLMQLLVHGPGAPLRPQPLPGPHDRTPPPPPPPGSAGALFGHQLP